MAEICAVVAVCIILVIFILALDNRDLTPRGEITHDITQSVAILVKDTLQEAINKYNAHNKFNDIRIVNTDQGKMIYVFNTITFDFVPVFRCCMYNCNGKIQMRNDLPNELHAICAYTLMQLQQELGTKYKCTMRLYE